MAKKSIDPRSDLPRTREGLCRRTNAESNLNLSLGYIADRWDLLQPHIREAIFTLIDASLQSDRQDAEREHLFKQQSRRE